MRIKSTRSSVKVTTCLSIKFFLCCALLTILPVQIFAEEGDGGSDALDTYIAPLDETGSDESLREQAGSGFDTPGPIPVDEDYYNSTQPDDQENQEGSNEQTTEDSN